MARIGPIFVSHGSPMMALSPTPAHRFLQGLGQQIGHPRAILCISAHWETTVPELSGADEPATIHDFYGFPQELYKLHYTAPGAPDVAEERRAIPAVAVPARLTLPAWQATARGGRRPTSSCSCASPAARRRSSSESVDSSSTAKRRRGLP